MQCFIGSVRFLFLSVLLITGMAKIASAQTTSDIPVFQPACRQMSIDILNVGTTPKLREQLALRQVKADVSFSAPDVTIALIDAGVALVETIADRLTTAVDLVARNEVQQAKIHAKLREEQANADLEDVKRSVKGELETAKRDAEVRLRVAAEQAKRQGDKTIIESAKGRIKHLLEEAKRAGALRLRGAELRAKEATRDAKTSGDFIKQAAKRHAIERMLDGSSLSGHGEVHPWAPDDPKAWEGQGHGTAMASLVAATVGEAKILPVRVIGEGCLGTALELAWGIEVAAELGADVISVSVSTPEYSERLAEAVAFARASGALVIAASGNNGEVEYPAAFPSVISVTAVDHEGWPMPFAPGGDLVDIAAPGMEVIAASPAPGLPGVAEGREALTGTSPATALVAAAAAVVVQRTPLATVEEREELLLQAVRPPEETRPHLPGELGRGLLDFSRLPTTPPD